MSGGYERVGFWVISSSCLHCGRCFQPLPTGKVSSSCCCCYCRGCRCVHIHRCMGRMASMRRYYLDQRRLQITTDLAPPANFLEAYQSYLAQVRER